MSSQYVYQRGVGQYRSSEIHNLITGRSVYPANGLRRGIIYCHGAGQTGDSIVHTTGAFAQAALALAAAGYPVVSCDLGAAAYSFNAWGNDDSIDALAAAWAYLTGTLGAATDQVGLLCASMGALTGLNWARQNLSEVFAVVAGVPVLDLDDVYQNDKGGYRSDIETAYAITHPTAIPNLATHSPVDYGSSDLDGLPIGLWSASDDPIASTTAACEAWNGAGADVTVNDLGAVGHNPATMSAQDVLAFFDANGGRSPLP